jgi:hypothetical protein
MAALAALAVLAWWPAVGAAAQTVIENPSGPLSSIFIDEDLGCQVQATGDIDPSFFGGTEPGACGTFLALTAGEDLGLPASHHLFGPSPPAGVFPEADFTPVVAGAGDQTFAGSGTAAEPFTITTHVTADETGPEGPSGEPGEPVAVADLIETDSYVIGQDSYETTITIRNLGDTRLEGTLYHAGDCFLSNLDVGFGAANVPDEGSVACTIDPNDNPPARFMAFTPIFTSGPPEILASHDMESGFSTVWEHVNATGEQFPDTVDATTEQDNGMGLSWPIDLNILDSSENEATLKLTTTISASLTSSTTAGACVPSGQVPITLSAIHGAKQINYAVDGGPVQSVATDESGQATIALAPGQHTLEYWGEEQTGTQESPHHVVSVTVASGGPSLTIASDQGKSGYLAGEPASVTIAAAGPGLTSDPSAAHVPISTAAPGTFSVTRSAADACGTTDASFAYTVTATAAAHRATLADLPSPVLGQSVNVEPVSGEVLVKLPPTGHASLAGPLESAASLGAATESLNKGVGFIPLREARQIPVGSILDTTAGVARIATATAKAGQQQLGDFEAGIFKLLQRRRLRGLTEMDIIDSHSARQVCATQGKARIAAGHPSSKVLGRLTANSHGHFTARGQYSAATVRGTIWGVINRCDGTLTRVTRGVLSVRDFRRRKTITLFTGQTYLAKAPHY